MEGDTTGHVGIRILHEPLVPLEWLKRHKRELVIGTVVVVAGVAFVITTGGTGTLLLVPLAL